MKLILSNYAIHWGLCAIAYRGHAGFLVFTVSQEKVGHRNAHELLSGVAVCLHHISRALCT